MKRLFSIAAVILFANQLLLAQNLDLGKKLYYYERFNSAKEELEKTVAATPSSVDAIYWLGQTLISLKDTAGARDLFAKSLAQNGNAPLLITGMGHVELMEGKTADARQRFELAIATTKAKDIVILNAVGLANAKTRAGDATYAIEKLNLATQIKNFKNADTYIIMGDAYRKLIDGGNSVLSYTKALGIDPTLAAAKHKIALVYLTQNNKDYFLPNFEEAVQLDAKYAPTLFELFYYWYFRDVNKAATFLEQYVNNTDQGPKVEYLKTDFLYASSKFAEAKQKAQGLIQQYGDKVDPRMYRMIAYTSDTTGDIAGAKTAMLTFLSKAAPEDIMPTDYEELAAINMKIEGMDEEVHSNLLSAIKADTLMENKVKYVNKAAAYAKKKGNRKKEASWLGYAYTMKKNPNANDLYNWGLSSYQAGDYLASDSIFCNLYQSKYPDQIFGYLWCARSKQALDDSTNSKGLAVEAYKLLAEKARQIDAVKYKSQAVSAYFFLIQYYNDVAKEKETAISYCDKILEMDAANETALKIKDILTKAATKQPATGAPKKPATPPAKG